MGSLQRSPDPLTGFGGGDGIGEDREGVMGKRERWVRRKAGEGVIRPEEERREGITRFTIHQCRQVCKVH